MPTLRLGTHDDLDAVHTMQLEWEREESVWGFTPDDRVDLDRWPAGYFVVAGEAGELIGFGHGSEVLSEGLAVIPAGERYLDVEALYVRSDRRRAGLGGLILDELRALARADGIERAFVFTAAKDQHAIMRFYERHGLRPWGMQFFI